MRITKSSFLYIAIAAFGLASCKKSNPTPPPPVKDPDIYVAGDAHDVANNKVAVYWKNNVPHKLTNSVTQSGATDMLVNDTDVYVTGYTVAQGNYINSATYWKNGLPTTMGYNSGASSIALKGSDVYVAFINVPDPGFSQAYYWKNGTSTPLTDGSAQSLTSSILVNGSDIYVTGASANNNSNDYNIEATYWKNGVITKLVNSTFSSSLANTILVQGTDVYITGFIRSQNSTEAVYWKNGTMVKLATDPLDAHAYAIAIKGTDIYVAGRVNGKGTYWKNGVATTLSTGTLTSVAIVGNDVYFAGEDNAQACYWKNGVKVQLSPVSGYTNYSTSYKIIVVPR